MSVARSSVRKCNVGLVITCLIGLGLSYYTYVVEIEREKNESYRPMCDISEHISCTKAFMSEYGKGFGLFPKNCILGLHDVPNPVFGLIFFSLVILLSLSNNYNSAFVVVILATLSNIISAYLAYILYQMKNICIVCVSTYIVNAVLFYLATRKLRALRDINIRKKKK